jgi:two-component system alkaline phosphatase synthesis response regulator PhoP
MHRPHILLVDDDPLLLELVSRNLREDQYEVTTASDGAEGLQAAERLRPDLVLVDSTMPGHDAVEFIKQVRELHTYRVPVISMTVFNGNGGGEEALDAGADDYVAKPFNHALLIDRIRHVLDSCQS